MRSRTLRRDGADSARGAHRSLGAAVNAKSSGTALSARDKVPAGRRDLPPHSLWSEAAGTGSGTAPPRPPLPGDATADVAIVGAGFTGLWTAHRLLRHDPTLRVTVLERAVAGFGASGRNGGWCSALFPVSEHRVDRAGGPGAGYALRAELRREVGRVVGFCSERGVDAVLGGELVLARTASQRERLRAAATGEIQWLEPAEVQQRIRAAHVLGASFDPSCAALHPGDLVRTLAATVVAQGVALHEGTTVASIASGRVRTDRGDIRAPVVIRATEAWTPALPGQARAVAPVYSLVIATAPLAPSVWETIGWHGRETVTDGRNLIVYAQRTADGRIVFGGRGAPYHWGSRIEPRFDRSPQVFDALEAALYELLPATRGAEITHRWGGPLGVPRDFFPSVCFDPATGLGSAGGYVGDGVAASALAGRTLADLVLGRNTERTHLAWVNHRSPRWEPEPLRWLGINAGRVLAASVDQAESRDRRPRRRAALLAVLTGS